MRASIDIRRSRSRHLASTEWLRSLNSSPFGAPSDGENDSWTLTGDQEHANPVHFIEMWVFPDTANVTSGCGQLNINAPLEWSVEDYGRRPPFTQTYAEGLVAENGKTRLLRE
ncbi:hypothetical protein [Streptomyces sp. NPDC059466]|uniref:hypothetical protein n=1 Tax=unclassified Streptomyces TaxID=2593676 RepID=UPI0036953FD0